jgi:tripartite-type tricarboxylate transporter receptor subunit TctC
MTAFRGTVPWLQKWVVALALAMMPASIGVTRAQDYPNRPITIIVPLVAGGSVDVVARILADRMKTTLGQPMVVENIPTAAGTLGVGRLTQATPDGYTIGVGDQTSHVVSSLVNPVRYDVLKDLEPISLLSTSSIALVARKTLQAADVKQLIVWLREQPEGATAGSFGQGSGPHVISTAFQNLTGTKLRLVSYRGTPLALQDVVGGQIDLLFIEQSNMIGQLREGTIKAYAVLSENRSAALPNVPTIDEAGGPSLHVATWRGMWAPKGTPTDVLSKLRAAVIEALGDPAVQKRIAETSQEIVPRAQQTPEALAAHHSAEMEKWRAMIKAANVKAD